MLDCEDFGYIIIYTKTGAQKTLDHATTVNLCKKAQEEGVGIEEIIKREIEPALKLIKFRN
ncbi:MAG: hypothetical protein B2I17_09405 [Thermoplasmatales archaeon B_DKE]|nr:MAG: hypothetical protein B2I17_09405 [Thermoplasmatales archaeon B_DKE]